GATHSGPVFPLLSAQSGKYPQVCPELQLQVDNDHQASTRLQLICQRIRMQEDTLLSADVTPCSWTTQLFKP
ncbi:mCG142589, isoform CRA_c, partial [Mus musculus]